jgi:hypothetical protein
MRRVVSSFSFGSSTLLTFVQLIKVIGKSRHLASPPASRYEDDTRLSLTFSLQSRADAKLSSFFAQVREDSVVMQYLHVDEEDEDAVEQEWRGFTNLILYCIIH